jgi:glycosyltransferase involved in cell wall biosynthesis
MEKPGMPKNIPAISVIIPAYNQAMYVSEAIRSVLGQTYPDFELIVVDDGSTDETSQILAGFQDPRIHVIRQSNAGLSSARNTGLHESTAPLVTFLDADDYFLPNKLEVLSRYLENNLEIGLVAGRVIYIDHTGRTLVEAEKPSSLLELPGLLFENPICVSGILLRRNWLERVGVFDESLRACEDWDLWLRLLIEGCQMAWVENLVVAYRIHPGQMTRQSDRMRKAIFAMLDKFFIRPDLDENLRRHKDVAYSSGWIHAAVYAYLSGEADKGANFLQEAISHDPTLRDQHYQRLVRFLMGWAYDPRVIDPVVFLQQIITNPPPGEPGLVLPLRQALADIILASLFQSSKETWRLRRGDLLSVIRYRPGWLLNRGVLRMLAHAWLNL